MTNEAADENDLVAGILDHLQAAGFVVERSPTRDTFSVRSYRGVAFPLTPRLTIPPALLREYLEDMSRRGGAPGGGVDEALSLTRVHLVEELTTDHGDGLNYVSALGYRRNRGKVEFFVDQELPPPGHAHHRASDLEWRAHPPAQ